MKKQIKALKLLGWTYVEDEEGQRVIKENIKGSTKKYEITPSNQVWIENRHKDFKDAFKELVKEFDVDLEIDEMGSTWRYRGVSYITMVAQALAFKEELENALEFLKELEA